MVDPAVTEAPVADALVIFGITGDLAKIMTLRSLYRLERRKLLNQPVIGVAVDDWTIEQLIDHAHESIEATGEKIEPAVFKRFAERLHYVSGDFANEATYDAVKNALGDLKNPAFYLEIPPLPVLTRGRRPAWRRIARGRQSRGGREAVRPRSRFGAPTGGRPAPVPG